MNDSASPEHPLLLTVVGTDHHPFQRLVNWLDRWLADGGATRTRCVLQYGTAEPPQAGDARQYLGHAELQRLMAEAAVVVSHGGPATIMECRRTGHLPIVVPRDSARGEHVDEHQLHFARRLAREGLVALCESEEALRQTLDEALTRPAQFRVATAGQVASGEAEMSAPVRRTAELLDALIAGRRPDRAADPVRVAFLGGFGRSGSTLLQQLLGELPQVCAIGETVHLWERSLRNNELCGCGTPFHDCPFWRKVGEVAYGGWANIDADAVLALKRLVDRNRFIPQLAAPRIRRGMASSVERYVGLYARLYDAVRQVSGCAVVVDSSKHASLAFALRWAREVDLRVLHVVRDSPGVAYSWSKQVVRPEVTAESAYMPRYSPVWAGVLWDAHNSMFELLSAVGTPVRRVRYEDVLRDPVGELSGIVDFLNVPEAADRLPMFDQRVVHLTTTHTVAGNPMRFTTGELALSRDDAWQSELSARRRRVVTALTLPLRARYGYIPERLS